MSKEEFLREISKTVKLSIDSNKITYLILMSLAIQVNGGRQSFCLDILG